MEQNNFPYEECETCKDLGDCKHVDVAIDGLATNLPPDCCPKPIEVMKCSLKKRKSYRHKDDI